MVLLHENLLFVHKFCRLHIRSSRLSCCLFPLELVPILRVVNSIHYPIYLPISSCTPPIRARPTCASVQRFAPAGDACPASVAPRDRPPTQQSKYTHAGTVTNPSSPPLLDQNGHKGIDSPPYSLRWIKVNTQHSIKKWKRVGETGVAADSTGPKSIRFFFFYKWNALKKFITFFTFQIMAQKCI